ncbi:hypothetical protein A1O1_05290 [Capronia coronata CBS 617.96]|uniref:RING-type E3 ubiquitin transferase n=1 Tax=Capronia coronata CBS 617.96 TaxID=1182541 RepID=W9YFE1_9EURO|nr:uncharacterized protein A1O1_05290 [Capronia coronata CBS 617.96]EXJ88360.1 hypothetical protein A1O1_05290 [Capronia coronata CBS 617.96]
MRSQASTALAAGVILKALTQRPNFYSAAVYLSQSSANLMILTNLLFVVACTFLLGLQKLLYGSLRPIEIEQLYEKAWFAVTETCLAMTVFRGEVGLPFLAMFFALLTGKVWGWIGEGRVEVLEQQPPRNPRLFHTRLALSLGLSVAFDLTMLEYVVKQVMRMARPDMMVMFGFEFAVLSVMSISTAMRYAIDLVEIGIVREQKRLRIEEIKRERVQTAVAEFQEAQNAVVTASDADTPTTPTPTQRTLEQVSEDVFNQPVDENEVEVEGWEEKGRYMFYLNLTTDFFKLVIYLTFFFILLVFYGLPIHILRDVFLTMRSFLKRISDFIKYRAATRDMNARYPDATEEDIGREDVCIICREEMRPYQPPVAEPGQPRPRGTPVAERMRPKKLPCGHVLHFSCLRSWLERQQICPTCRANVVRSGRARGDAGAAGQPGGARGGDGQARPAGRQGPRVYQFGPLRIGVGAVRGNNMFEDLQQQLEEVRQAGGPGQAPGPAGDDVNAPRQFGIGYRWQTGARRQRTGEAQDMTTQEQLDALRGQLDREMHELAHNSAELSVLRSMQAEMQRLRNIRPGETLDHANTEAPGANPAATFAAAPAPAPPPQPSGGQRAARTTQFLSAGGPHEVIYAGSDRLPPGLTLPEGWSIMPLRSTTIEGLRPASAASVRNLAAGLEMMQRQFPNQHFGWFPQPQPFQHPTGLNGGGQGQTATFHLHPQGLQEQPQPHYQPRPQPQPAHQNHPLSVAGAHLFPPLQRPAENSNQQPSGPTEASTTVQPTVNGASVAATPGLPGVDRGVSDVAVPPTTQEPQHSPTLFSMPLLPTTNTAVPAPEHQQPPPFSPGAPETRGQGLPAWGRVAMSNGENSTTQPVNGGSGASTAEDAEPSLSRTGNGDISHTALDDGHRHDAEDENQGHVSAAFASDSALSERRTPGPSSEQSAAKDRHVTVEDVVGDPD